MYRFVLSRRWLLAHVVIVAVVGSCVSLGFWQLRRLEERRTRNRLTVDRLNLPAVSTQTLLAAPRDTVGSALAYRRAELRGIYDPDQEVSLYGRSLEGRSGTHSLVPLVTADGTALIVDRGWAPLEGKAGSPGRADPPRGEVRVVGILAPSEGASRLGSGRASGPVKVTARIDLGLLGRELPYPIYPLYVLLQDQDPPQPTGLPRPGELPRLSEGPHFSYAMQWFLFGVVAVAGYAGVLRRAAKERATRPEKAPLPA
ncbi:MAG: SURF1 family cytochrome oxidase biogenesis protein [Actinomycetota bacterium]